MRDEGGEAVEKVPAPVILVVMRDCQQPLPGFQRMNVFHKAAVLAAIAGVLPLNERPFSARRTGCHFSLPPPSWFAFVQNANFDDPRQYKPILPLFKRFVECFLWFFYDLCAHFFC